MANNIGSYANGLNDAWELAKKIYRMSEKEKYEVFGVPVAFTYDILCEFTVEEALAKIEEYEKRIGKINDVWYKQRVSRFYGTCESVRNDIRTTTGKRNVVKNEERTFWQRQVQEGLRN